MTPGQLIRHFGKGDLTEAARHVPVTRQTLTHWKQTGKIPGRWQAWFQLKTDHKLVADMEAAP